MEHEAAAILFSRTSSTNQQFITTRRAAINADNNRG
jgi:hypothetical protein